MSPLTRVLLSFFALMVACAGWSQATQILYQSPKQMGQKSPLIVQGRVVDTHSYWNDTGNKIFTETTIQVDEAHKGAAPSTVTVLQLGGVVGTVRMTVHGALQWQPDEEIVVFLEPCTSGTYQVSGFSQGKFSIERDPGTGKAFVKWPTLDDEVELVGAPARDGAARSRTDKVTLESFLDEALGAGRKGGLR